MHARLLKAVKFLVDKMRHVTSTMIIPEMIDGVIVFEIFSFATVIRPDHNMHIQCIQVYLHFCMNMHAVAHSL